MKKYLQFIVCACLAAIGTTGCDNGDDSADSRITVTPSKLEFTLEGGAQRVAIASANWNATTEAEWITITPDAEGVLVTVTATDEARIGEITVANTVDSKTITVIQNADVVPSIKLSAGRLQFTSESTTKSVTVESELIWAVSSEQEWITVTKSGDSEFVVRVAAYDGTEPREGIVTVDNGEVQAVLTVVQDEPYGYEMTHAYADQNYGTETTTTLLFNMTDAASEENPQLFAGEGIYMNFLITMPVVSHDGPSLEIKPGTYTFTKGESAEREFTADLNNFSYIVETDTPGVSTLGDKIDFKQGKLVISGDRHEYLIRCEVELEDGTTFKCYYLGALNIKNPLVLTQLWDDYELLPLTHSNIGFRGDVIGNGTHAWAIELFSEGIYEQNGYMEGNGNHVQIMLVSDQSGDGTVLPDGTYEFHDLPDADFVAGQAISGFGEWGYGSWINEMTNGWILGSGLAPLYSGTFTSKYNPEEETYDFEIDAWDDAHNHITGTFHGQLYWFKVGDMPVGTEAQAMKAVPTKAPARKQIR